jgi:hypothetical protein
MRFSERPSVVTDLTRCIHLPRPLAHLRISARVALRVAPSDSSDSFLRKSRCLAELVAWKEPHLDILLHRSLGDTESLSGNLIGLNNQIIMGRVT